MNQKEVERNHVNNPWEEMDGTPTLKKPFIQ
jgi:hypothetical protein